MHVYVISLARSEDRRSHMSAQLDRTGMSYEIVEAVDGRTLDLRDANIVHPAADSSFSPGVFGCVLSHLKVYRKIIAEGLDAALVLEDDVILPRDLHALTNAVVQNMRGAEVVLLNFHSYEVRFTKTGSIPLPSARRLTQIVDKGTPWSGAAYLITLAACERMARTVLPVRARADSWAHFYREQALDRVRCVVPMPVAINVNLRTTKDNFEPHSWQARLLETVATNRLPIAYQMLAWRRQRSLRHYQTGRAEYADDLPGADPLPVLSRIQ